MKYRCLVRGEHVPADGQAVDGPKGFIASVLIDADVPDEVKSRAFQAVQQAECLRSVTFHEHGPTLSILGVAPAGRTNGPLIEFTWYPMSDG